MTDRSSWNMAAIASRRAIAKQRKVFAPVGSPHVVLGAGVDVVYDQAHKCCGYHVCSCAPKPAIGAFKNCVHHRVFCKGDVTASAYIVDGKLRGVDAYSTERACSRPVAYIVQCGEWGADADMADDAMVEWIASLGLDKPLTSL